MSSLDRCERARETIHRRLDGEPTDVAALTQLEDHLRCCESCRELDEELRRVQQGLRSLPTLKLPDGVLERVFDEIARDPARPRRPAWAALVAASLLVALGGWWVTQQQRTPSDSDVARASREARLVFKLAAEALKQTERTAFHEVVGDELGGALRRAPMEWPVTSSVQQRGS